MIEWERRLVSSKTDAGLMDHERLIDLRVRLEFNNRVWNARKRDLPEGVAYLLARRRLGRDLDTRAASVFEAPGRFLALQAWLRAKGARRLRTLIKRGQYCRILQEIAWKAAV